MTSRPSRDELLADLADEHEDLDRVLVAIAAESWDVATPAEGWSVRDTVSHLAYFDERATEAVTAPDTFRAGLSEVLADPEAFINAGPMRGRRLAPDDVLAWWRSARAGVLEAFRAADPSLRVPWYGPDMSVRSLVTARVMETWAHGQDVVDAVGVRRSPTARLRHVAHLGVATYRYSFVATGRDAPTVDVLVELAAPDGATWVYGPDDADNRVTGSALGFCLLVTQRRHLSDTDVRADGQVAAEWLSIAQAFAGPAGSGRQPGLPAY
ncbi:MAG: TIGR03084 family metal-binding protein [Actinomycetes bacterium]